MRAIPLLVAVCASAACGGAASNGLAKPTTPVAAAPTLVTWDRLTGPIRSVSLTGGTPTDYTRVQPIVNALVGQPLNRDALRATLDQIMGPQTLVDLEVTGEQLADGVKLIVAMKAQPTVLSVNVSEAAQQYVPMAAFSDIVGQPLSPPGLTAGIAALKDFFYEKGNAAFTAHWRTIAKPNGVDVVVDAVVGEALLVAGHDYRGNTHVKAAELDKALNGEVSVGSPWRPDHVERAVLMLTSYYFDHGYVTAAITPPPLPAKNPAQMIFAIKEGDQYKFGKLEITGIPPADAAKLKPLLTLKPGAIFSRSAVIAVITAIHNKLVATNPHVDIEPLTTIDAPTKTIAVNLQISLAPSS